jgi:mono/diheme cytochrome c family protein
MIPLEQPKSHKLTIIIVVLLILAVLAYGAWYKLLREVDPYHASELEHFEHGSVGTEAQQGMPLWIWIVLPRMFPEYLPRPGGWGAIGLPTENFEELPVGFSKVTVGVERVGINCSFCHTATWRAAPGPPTGPTGPEAQVVTHIVPGGPSNQFNVQAYQDFLWACASDTRFTSKNIMAEIARIKKLSTIDSLLYRFVLIPATRSALLKQKQQFSWTNDRPRWLHGRVDPFNGVKYATLKVPMDHTIGNSDMPAVWNQKARGAHSGFARHWDGLNPDLTEVVISSSIGDGSTLKWLDNDIKKWDGTGENRSSVRRVQEWLMEAPVAKYPFPIDTALAAKGKPVYDKECADCHAFGGKRTGTIIPAAETGTDTHRLAMWTQDSVVAYTNLAAPYKWKMTHFVKNDGWASVALDGIWLRGPYLHNGSVPTLTDLLNPVEQRTKKFYRGYDVIDQVGVGFVNTGSEAEKYGSLVDTSVEGNGNAGHLWGVNLPADQKKALVEYMKTL